MSSWQTTDLSPFYSWENIPLAWVKEGEILLPSLLFWDWQSSTVKRWIPENGKAPFGIMYQNLRHALIDRLIHLLHHDVNGKMMGLEGLLNEWKEAPPDGHDSCYNDLKMVYDSFTALKSLSQAMHLLIVPQEKQLLTPFQFKQCEIFSRLLPPGSSLTFPEKGSWEVAPGIFLFWLMASLLVLGQMGKTAMACKILLPEREAVLMLSVPHLSFKNIPPLFWNWVPLVIQRGGSFSQTAKETLFKIPLHQLSPFQAEALSHAGTVTVQKISLHAGESQAFQIPFSLEPEVSHQVQMMADALGVPVYLSKPS